MWRLLTWGTGCDLVRAGSVQRAHRKNATWQEAQATWREQRYHHGRPQAVPHTPHNTCAEGRRMRNDVSHEAHLAHLTSTTSMPARPLAAPTRRCRTTCNLRSGRTCRLGARIGRTTSCDYLTCLRQRACAKLNTCSTVRAALSSPRSLGIATPTHTRTARLRTYCMARTLVATHRI